MIVFGVFPVFKKRKLAFPQNPAHISDETKRFIEICLVIDQNSRPNFEDLLRNDYFNEFKEERKDNAADADRTDRMNELINNVNRLSIRPASIILDTVDHPKIVADPVLDLENLEGPEELMRFPDNKPEIEELVLMVFFLSDDVMNYVEKYRNEHEFLVFFSAEHFTDQCKFILENLMESAVCYEFGDGFFEQFFSKSEKIINICNHLEQKYKHYTNDQYFAARLQIDEIIYSERNTAQEHILKVLEDISQKLSRRTELS